MNKQITQNAILQTIPTALKTISGHGKSAGKGIFTKLFAIIESKTIVDGYANPEKFGKHSDETLIANPATARKIKAIVDLLPVIKSDDQKIKSEQNNSSELIIASVDFTVANHNHDNAKLLTDVELAAANTKAEVKHAIANSVAGEERLFPAVKADIDHPVKARTGAEVKHELANTAVDRVESSSTLRTDTDQPVKFRAGAEVKHAVADPAAGRGEAATILGKTSNPGPITGAEYTASANEQRIAGMKAEIKQAVSTKQPEKSLLPPPEVDISFNLPESHKLSTNNFVRSRKLNSDNLSRPKAPLLQTSPDKKQEISVGNNTYPLARPAAPLANSMRDVIFQTDSLSRPEHQSHDVLNSQIFQASSPDSTSTFMRSVFQPHQSISNAGPWSVAAAMQQISHAAGQGKFQMELTLTPAHLGKVRVFLDSDANKQIQVHFIIDQPASRQTIEQHLPVLRQALVDQGLNMDSFSMESSGQHTDNQQDQQNRNAPSGSIIADSSSTGSNRAEPSSDSRLSIRI
jgi:flagellar hook-length control protein FliK